MPDNVPDFLDQLERRALADFHDQARQTLLNETAGWFATHPTAAQRIRKARQREEPGIFSLEEPARALFTDFTATARVVTRRHYCQNLRLAVNQPMLRPVSDFSMPRAIPDQKHHRPSQPDEHERGRFRN